ncbi:MAG: MarR family winged helix-turn-helix transcriptional regulator [Polyangiaceae bacterium]
MGYHASPDSSTEAAASAELRTTLDGLRHIVRVLRLSSTQVERAHGISGAQLFVLQTLTDAPAPSIATLATRTATDASSVSVVVTKLVDKGLVVRRTSKEDGRRAEIALTKNGDAVARSTPPVPQALLVTAFSKLAQSTRKALARGLKDLVKEMGAVGEPGLFFEEDHMPRLSAVSRRRRGIS